MPENQGAYTLWNSPMDSWTTINSGELSQESVVEITKAVQEIDNKAISERTQPFKAEVTESTLSKFIS